VRSIHELADNGDAFILSDSLNPVAMFLLRKALRLSAALVLSCLFLTVAPTDAYAERPQCEVRAGEADGYCIAIWLCDDGSGGWALTDPEVC
jgi:hypothetical protein